MIISLGFRFKNVIQRIGGTRPAAEYRDRRFAHTSPAGITKQFYNEMFCFESRPAFVHLGIWTLSKAEDLSGEFPASAVATTTSPELRSSGPKENRQTWHDSMEFPRRSSFQSSHTQFYSDWTDAGLEKMGPLASWWHVTTYYFDDAFPERWSKALFAAGILTLLWKCRPVHLALAGGGVLCFVAHPLHMKLWPHHVMPWLPLLCFIAAAPAGLVGSWLLNWYRHKGVAAVAVMLLAGGVTIGLCSIRLGQADHYLNISQARTNDIVHMNQWLGKNTTPDTYLLEGFFALNEDGFRKWIENAGVLIPAFGRPRPNLRIWWLERQSVDGHAGVLCLSKGDITFFHDDYERKQPGSTYNPFENANFKQVAHFGVGFYELGIFQFDCRSKSCSH